MLSMDDWFQIVWQTFESNFSFRMRYIALDIQLTFYTGYKMYCIKSAINSKYFVIISMPSLTSSKQIEFLGILLGCCEKTVRIRYQSLEFLNIFLILIFLLSNSCSFIIIFFETMYTDTKTTLTLQIIMWRRKHPLTNIFQEGTNVTNYLLLRKCSIKENILF